MKHFQPADNRDGPENAEEPVNAEEPANSEVLDLTSQQDVARQRKFRETVDKINEEYANVFRRLSQ